MRRSSLPSAAHRSRSTRLFSSSCPFQLLAAAVCLATLATSPGTLSAQESGDAGSSDGAASSGVRAVAALRSGPVNLDGRPDEDAWLAAEPLTDFVQREPAEGLPASERTEVRILYDDGGLWIGARMYDSEPDAVVYGETRRDASLDNADALLLVLDTYLDRQNGFVFGTAPSGLEFDGQVTREGEGGMGGNPRQQAGSGGGFNVNWDGSWQVATARTGDGWSAELRIPFSTLRYEAGGAQEWGLNIVRRIRRKNEEVFWSPVPRRYDLNRVSLAGTLTGVRAPERRVLDVTPYVLGSARRDYTDGVAGPSTTWRGEVGGDAKIGLTPSLTLDLTANTDFAQVEVDEEQVNLTRFRLFFPEKRPFFLENAGTFAVGTPQSVELFFSRRIGIEGGREVPILGGGRVTGKVGGLTVGLLDIQTEGVDGVAPANNFGAARVFRELGGRSRLGATFVSRVSTDDPDDHNLTWGLDGRLGLGDSFLLEGYGALTETPGLTGGEGAWSLDAQYDGEDWRVGGGFREVQEDFNPEVGFLPRTAYRFYSANVLRRYRFPEVSWFRELRPHASIREFVDLDGFSETRLIHIDSHFEFENGAFFQLPSVNFNREGLREPFEVHPGVVVPPGTYDHFDWGFRFNTDLSAPLAVEGRIDLGGLYTGTRYGSATTLHARMGESLVTSFRVDYNDVNLAEGDFETLVLGLRAAWAFTPRIYLQSLVQYNDLTRNVSGNVRFGWLNTAGTGLFLVYNDVEHTGRFRNTGVFRGPLDRTLVVKFTRRFGLGS